jgi:hypothetical protein
MLPQSGSATESIMANLLQSGLLESYCTTWSAGTFPLKEMSRFFVLKSVFEAASLTVSFSLALARGTIPSPQLKKNLSFLCGLSGFCKIVDLSRVDAQVQFISTDIC